MTATIPVIVESDVISSLCRFCQGQRKLTLVADQNTFQALGRAVERGLRAGGLDVQTIVLTGDEVIADEHYIMQVLVSSGREDRTYLAVGSGTINDIVRFASHRTKDSFISVPTAPSVDGYTSIGAPLVVGGFKQTLTCHPPIAVFADLGTLGAAPRPMIAAGFGDMLGKYTALADWKLGQLLWEEPYDDQVAQRTRRALQSCIDHAGEIGQVSPVGIQTLIEALVESGLCMLDFGDSHPASGSEHHVSHFWEMRLLQENRPAILHGAKVGVACVLVAQLYERIRQLTRDQVREMLARTPRPDRDEEIRRIRAVYGSTADQVIAGQASFLDRSPADYGSLQQRIVERWPEVQESAAAVPLPPQLAELLGTVGGPEDSAALGLSDQERDLALEFGHYIRARFTVVKLCRMLGLMP